MNEVEQKVLEAVDIDGMLDYLCQLIAVKSISGEETAAQRHVAMQMKALGLEIDVWELNFPELSAHPAYSAEVERERGLGVVGMMGAGNGRSLILNGHTDVVPAGDETNWHYPPWQGTTENGRVYGRGALDMKGGLTCALFAAKAIRDAGVTLKGQLLIHSVIGEEDGGVGTLATILHGHTADAAIVMEPTELMLAPAQAGAFNFRITIPGRAAHGCFRSEGVSPIEKFMPIYDSLMKLETERNREVTNPLFAPYDLPYALCIGTIEAGVWASTVAESLTFAGRYGVAVDEDTALARRQFEQTVAAAAAADPWLRHHPPQVEWWGGQFMPASTPVDHPIVTTVAETYEAVAGTAVTIQGMPYGADMRLLVNEGNIPTVLFGPGNVRRAHRPDEFVPMADLVTTVRTLALTAVRFCGVQEADL